MAPARFFHFLHPVALPGPQEGDRLGEDELVKRSWTPTHQVPPCTVEPESSTYLVECLNNGSEAEGKETAQKQGVPTIYSFMQIGPQAPEEGPWLSLIAALQGRGGGRVGPTQRSVGASSLGPAEASQDFPSHLWAPSFCSPASLAHNGGSPMKQRALDLVGVKGSGYESQSPHL